MSAIVDSEDWDKIKNYTWGFGYGRTYVGANTKIRGKCILLHRFIMNTPKGFHTDHINGNHLDNRKSNLRICTPAQNQFNSRKNKHKTSSYKGVCWYKRDKCWRAYINLSRKQIHLGYFTDEKQAAQAYNKKSKEIYGSFACLNIL